MYDRHIYLFSGASVFDVTSQIPQKALEAAKRYDENKILSSPVDDLINEIGLAFAVHIPELDDSATWIDEKEITREVQNQHYDMIWDREPGRRTITSHVVEFHVPFSGDKELFNIGPSQRSIPGPTAAVQNQELIISVETAGKNEAQIKQEYEGTVQDIKRHLETMRRDLSSLKSQVEMPVRNYLDQRKAQLMKSKNLVASLGFPMRRRSDAPTTYRTPEVRRRIVPVRPQVSAPFRPEPTLDEAEYQHVLKVMDNMTKVMERSPHTFQKMGEEDIRQHFLVQLNGQYDGQASGETFNFQGKTDILIRSEGKNIFIAECKFWHGEKGFVDTVDQLLSYLSWRDSKTAVVIFNRNKNLSGVLASIRQAMDRHPHKKRGPVVTGETSLRYVMGSPNDHSREIITTVMVYDIPQT